MSHNIKLSGVKFTDLSSLGVIVSDVSQGKAVLDVEGKSFRTYRGEDSRCDAVIRLLNDRYDIGLKKDGDHYVPIMESYLNYAGTCLGPRGYPLGLVQQEYALREAEYEAAQRSFETERVTLDDGKIMLRLVQNA